jgi:hypothetical protein
MKSASALLVPATTLLLIISAASLAFEASEAADAAAMAGAGLDRARQSAGEVAAALAALPPPAGVPDVNSVLAHTLVRLQKQARARLVAIERITANKQQGYAGADALAAPVPMTGNRILAVRLQMHGRYADYPLFKVFLEDLGHLAAIQSLKVVGDRFEAQLEIYGVGNV